MRSSLTQFTNTHTWGTMVKCQVNATNLVLSEVKNPIWERESVGGGIRSKYVCNWVVVSVRETNQWNRASQQGHFEGCSGWLSVEVAQEIVQPHWEMEGETTLVGALTPQSVSDQGQLTETGRKQSPEKQCTHYREKERDNSWQVTKEGEVWGKDGQVTCKKLHPHTVLHFATVRIFSAAKDTHLAQSSCHGPLVVYPLIHIKGGRSSVKMWRGWDL